MLEIETHLAWRYFENFPVHKIVNSEIGILEFFSRITGFTAVDSRLGAHHHVANDLQSSVYSRTEFASSVSFTQTRLENFQIIFTGFFYSDVKNFETGVINNRLPVTN